MADASNQLSPTSQASLGGRSIDPGFARYTRKQLQIRLGPLIVRAADQSKPFQRASLCLAQMGLLGAGQQPSNELWTKTVDWCDLPVQSLHANVRTYGVYAATRKKAELLKILIMAEVDASASALGRLTISDAPSLLRSPQPSQHIVNLLIATLFTDRLSREQAASLPNWFPNGREAMRQLINDLSSYPDAATLRTALGSPPLPSQKFLTNVCSSLTTQFTFLQASAKIPGFSDIIHQFRVNTTTPELEAAFQAAKTARGSTSRVLFHGTPLNNVRSILRKGFKACSHGNGVWLAEEPMVSYIYASKATASAFDQPCNFITVENVTDWDSSPYKAYGALLLCEAAGNGAPSNHRGGTTHVITDLKSVIVRYVLLLSPEVLRHGNGYAGRLSKWTWSERVHQPPTRTACVPAIEAGIAAR